MACLASATSGKAPTGRASVCETKNVGEGDGDSVWIYPRTRLETDRIVDETLDVDEAVPYNLSEFLGAASLPTGYRNGWLRGAPYSARYPETTLFLELIALLAGLCMYFGLRALRLYEGRYPHSETVLIKRRRTEEEDSEEHIATPRDSTSSGIRDWSIESTALDVCDAKADIYALGAEVVRLEEGVFQVVRASPERPAIRAQVENTGSSVSSLLLTYEQFGQWVDLVATALLAGLEASQGEQPLHAPDSEVLIGLLTSRSAEMIVGMIGILRAGAGYVPMEPTLPNSRLNFMLLDANLVGLCIGPGGNSVAKHFEGAVSFTYSICNTVDRSREVSTLDVNIRPACSVHSTAVVLYTSGSTGKPKGVLISHQAVVIGGGWRSSANRDYVNQDDKMLIVTSFSFYDHLTEIHGALSVGALLLVAPANALQDFSTLVRFVAEYQPSVLHWVPSVLHAYISEYGGIVSARATLSSGEPISASLARMFLDANFPSDARYVNLYGSTEIGNATSFEVAAQGARLIWESLPVVPAGIPLDCEAFLLNGHGNLVVEVGEESDLYVAGLGLAKGYLNLPQLTAETFVQHPLRHASSQINRGTAASIANINQVGSLGHFGIRAYRTGDVAKWLPQGGLQVVGRKDSLVKLNGQRIDLGEIEEALRQVEGVADAAAVLRDQRLIGYVTVKHSATRCTGNQNCSVPPQLVNLCPDNITAGLDATMLPKYMYPEDIVILEGDFPRTAGARKIDKQHLPVPIVPRLADSLSLMVKAAQGQLHVSEIYQGNLYVLCQFLVFLTHAYDQFCTEWTMVGPAACIQKCDHPVVRWFHSHDIVAPDICALLLVSAVADMRLLQRKRSELLRVAAYFLVLSVFLDFINFWIAIAFAYVRGDRPYRIWMVNYLHGPGKFSAGSYECNYYVGNWFLRVRAGMALVAWCFAPVLHQAEKKAHGRRKLIIVAGHSISLAGWVLLFSGFPLLSSILSMCAIIIWQIQPGHIVFFGSEWPAASPAIALFVLHGARVQRRIVYSDLPSAMYAEICDFLGLEDVWILSYFILPILVGGTRFPSALFKWKHLGSDLAGMWTRQPPYQSGKLPWIFISGVVKIIPTSLVIVAYIVGVLLLDLATHDYIDASVALKHRPGILPNRFNASWGFTSAFPSRILATYIGLPLLVLLFLLMIPTLETPATRWGLKGAMISYALHLPILQFQQTLSWVQGRFWRTTILSLVTTVALLHIPLPRWARPVDHKSSSK